ncbi:hypothetical protein KM043_003027 [Ampulex compressa]|nr:hypothetical protein KM043_003027 [Ampulex compressa]
MPRIRKKRRKLEFFAGPLSEASPPNYYDEIDLFASARGGKERGRKIVSFEGIGTYVPVGNSTLLGAAILGLALRQKSRKKISLALGNDLKRGSNRRETISRGGFIALRSLGPLSSNPSPCFSSCRGVQELGRGTSQARAGGESRRQSSSGEKKGKSGG